MTATDILYAMIAPPATIDGKAVDGRAVIESSRSCSL